MPTFVFTCIKCQHQFEFFKLLSDDKAVCSSCGSDELIREFTPGTAHILKGDSWAKDNYGLKPRKEVKDE